MTRKNESSQKAVMREMMHVLLKRTLVEELNEELCYSKYNHQNKDTNNGHSQKIMYISYGGIDFLAVQ